MGALRSLCAAAMAVACGGGDPAVVDPIVWTDVTVEAGLPFEAYSCLVFDDLDGDGRVDLLLGPGLPGLEDLGRVTAYAGRDGGRFARFSIPQATGQAVMSCDAADVTGDGLMDLFLGHVGGSVSYLRAVGAFAWEDASS